MATTEAPQHRPGATLVRGTSMFFDVLSREQDAEKAHALLDEAMSRAKRRQARAQQQREAPNGTPASATPPLGSTPHASHAASHHAGTASSSANGVSDSAMSVRASMLHSKSAGAFLAQPAAGDSQPHAQADSAAASEHEARAGHPEQQQLLPAPKGTGADAPAPIARGMAQADGPADGAAAVAVVASHPAPGQGVLAAASAPSLPMPSPGGGTMSMDIDLEGDKAALAQHLTHFTPEMILSELLGSLFIHPARLQWEGLLGQGGFATVHRASLLTHVGPEEPSAPGGGGGGGLWATPEDASSASRAREEGGSRRLGRRSAAGGEEGGEEAGMLCLAVAVKRLKPEVLGGSGDLKDFLLEANVLRKLRHPNIVSVRGIGAADLGSLESVRSSMYVVMEVLEGGTLKDMVLRQMTSRQSVYSAPQALRWAIQVASAMQYLHEVCRPMIIHRDMKLENVLLSGSPGSASLDRSQAKLADFGLHKRARITHLASPHGGGGPVLLSAAPTLVPMHALGATPSALQGVSALMTAMSVAAHGGLSPHGSQGGAQPPQQQDKGAWPLALAVLARAPSSTTTAQTDALVNGVPAAAYDDRSYYGGTVHMRAPAQQQIAAATTGTSMSAATTAIAAASSDEPSGHSAASRGLSPFAHASSRMSPFAGTSAAPAAGGPTTAPPLGKVSNAAPPSTSSANNTAHSATQALAALQAAAANLVAADAHASAAAAPAAPAPAPLTALQLSLRAPLASDALPLAAADALAPPAAQAPNRGLRRPPSLKHMVDVAATAAAFASSVAVATARASRDRSFHHTSATTTVGGDASAAAAAAAAAATATMAPSPSQPQPEEGGRRGHGGSAALSALSQALSQDLSFHAPDGSAHAPDAASHAALDAAGPQPPALSEAQTAASLPAPAPQPAAPLPAGMATLLADPAQAHNLQRLQTLLQLHELEHAPGHLHAHHQHHSHHPGHLHHAHTLHHGGSASAHPRQTAPGGSHHHSMLYFHHLHTNGAAAAPGAGGGVSKHGPGGSTHGALPPPPRAGRRGGFGRVASLPQLAEAVGAPPRDASAHGALLAAGSGAGGGDGQGPLPSHPSHSSQLQQQQHMDDVSVHRKMLALMALDMPSRPTSPPPPPSAAAAATATTSKPPDAAAPPAAEPDALAAPADARGPQTASQSSASWVGPACLLGRPMRAIPEDARASMDLRPWPSLGPASSQGQQDGSASLGLWAEGAAGEAPALAPTAEVPAAQAEDRSRRGGAAAPHSVEITPCGGEEAEEAAAAAAAQRSGRGGSVGGGAAARADEAGVGVSGRSGRSGAGGWSRSSADVAAAAAAGTSRSRAALEEGRRAPGTMSQAVLADATKQVGSYMYMAPELINHQPYNHKVDVFSFGVMLFELFSGKLLALRAELSAGGEEAVLAYVARRAAGERERLPARWPPALKQLVSDCWAQDPALRPSFGEVLSRLRELEATGALEDLVPSAQGALAHGGGGGCCTIM